MDDDRAHCHQRGESCYSKMCERSNQIDTFQLSVTLNPRLDNETTAHESVGSDGSVTEGIEIAASCGKHAAKPSAGLRKSWSWSITQSISTRISTKAHTRLQTWGMVAQYT